MGERAKKHNISKMNISQSKLGIWSKLYHIVLDWTCFFYENWMKFYDMFKTCLILFHNNIFLKFYDLIGFCLN